MATTEERLSVRDAFLACLSEAAQRRDERREMVPGPYNLGEAAWVGYEAKQMLALVNKLRAASGLPEATMGQVRRIEQSASGHVDYAHKYALRCAFLALGEEG